MRATAPLPCQSMARRELHDRYFRQAKREGYLARSAYKLIEIDDKRKLIEGRRSACQIQIPDFSSKSGYTKFNYFIN